MKKKLFALLLTMLMCLFSLTACVETESEVKETEIITSLTETAKTLVEQITSMDEATLAEKIEYYGIDGDNPDAGMLSGLTSWEGNRDDLGEFVSFGGCTVLFDTDENVYTAVAELEFTDRDCEFKMIVNRQRTEYESITFNPNFTFGEKMAKAAMNTVMGLGTVFVMLILISGLIYCFNFIHAWEENRSKKNSEPAAPAAAPEVPVVPAVEEVVEEELVDDLELVAVITAAIAASEGTSADGLIVRSIKRAPGSRWKRA
ncbi:MAG: OadG family protein [Lachnospiraceae bacterium]|nr:OadG family protein [Lachnospiraceae bacterium]